MYVSMVNSLSISDASNNKTIKIMQSSASVTSAHEINDILNDLIDEIEVLKLFQSEKLRIFKKQDSDKIDIENVEQDINHTDKETQLHEARRIMKGIKRKVEEETISKRLRIDS